MNLRSYLVALSVIITCTGAISADDAAKKKATAAELKNLEGTWQLVSAVTKGKAAPEEQVKQIRVVIHGNTHSVYFGDRAVVKDVHFTIDTKRSPMWTTDTLKNGNVIRGIYELRGDTLRSCVAPENKPRPTQFTGKAGSGWTLRVFRKGKPASTAKQDR